MKNYRTAVFASLGTSVLIAGIMSLWNWVENPGGIFQTADGANWQFIWDTFTSWFWPLIFIGIPLSLIIVFLKERLMPNQNLD